MAEQLDPREQLKRWRQRRDQDQTDQQQYRLDDTRPIPSHAALTGGPAVGRLFELDDRHLGAVRSSVGRSDRRTLGWSGRRGTQAAGSG